MSKHQLQMMSVSPVTTIPLRLALINEIHRDILLSLTYWATWLHVSPQKHPLPCSIYSDIGLPAAMTDPAAYKTIKK